MWIKNFRHKKLQTALIFIIIMLCSMLLTSSLSILKSLDKPLKDFAKECNSAAARLYPYSTVDSDVTALGKQFESLSETGKVEYLRTYYTTEDITVNGRKIVAFVNLTEYNDGVFGKAHYITGSKNITKLKEGECFIPACISNSCNIKTGDKINIKFSTGEVSYTVKGIFSEPYNISTAFDDNILVKKLPKGITGKLTIRLYGKNGASGSKIQEAYLEKYNGHLKGEIVTLEKTIDESLITGHVIGAVFLAISIIMLLVCCLIINFMIKSAMITDAKTIAVYKTIGYSSFDILIMYLSFYFIVVSAALVIGIVSSVFLSDTILISIFKNMGKVVTNNVLLPGAICYVFIITLVLGVIYVIIGKTKRIKPVYALNGMENSNSKKSTEYIGDSKMQFSPLGIALRTLRRNKKSAVSIILTAIVTIFSINFAVISIDIANSMKDNNDYWLGVDKGDVMIDVPGNSNYDKVQKIVGSDPRVDYYLNSNIDMHIPVKWKKGTNSTILYGFVFDDFSKAKMPVTKGRNPENANEIALGSKVARNLNKSVGDYIELYLGGEKSVNLLITGIFQSYMEMGDCARLTKSVYSENNHPFNYDNMSIHLKKHQDINKFITDIKKKIGSSGKVLPRTEAFSSIMDMIVKPQQSAIPPVVVLVLIVGALNIFCIVMLKNASSEKINGIYKCLGYTTSHLVLSNLYYVLVIAAASMTAAVPMVIAFYPDIMKASLSIFGFLKYPVSYNVLHIVLANLGTLVIFVLSTFISSRSLKKIDVRSLVQE